MFEDPKGVKDIDKYCKTAGVILIGLGILHIILSGFLSAEWGYLLIIIGIVSLSYRVKAIILVVGIALILVGLLNISSALFEISGFWIILGIVQIMWGIQELRRYSKTKENPKYIKKRKKKKTYLREKSLVKGRFK